MQPSSPADIIYIKFVARSDVANILYFWPWLECVWALAEVAEVFHGKHAYA